MTREELAESLARLSVETGSLVCLGCGYKNSCGTHGCAILRAAMETICSTALEQDGVRPIDANRLESSIQHIIDTCAGDFNKAIFAMFLDYIKQASTITPPNEWVSVEERLPEPTYCVLVYTTDYSIEVDAIGSDGEWMSYEVTHWMPLPTPPAKE